MTTHSRRLFPARLVLAALLVCASAVFARADFTFIHSTDTHVGATDRPDSNADKDRVLFKEISALTPKPAFIINTGDVCEIGTDEEYAIYRKVKQESLTVPIYDAPGNHDVRWGPRGKEGFTKGTGQPLYRSWDKENVHFVTLDSTVLLQHWGHFDQAMLDWLRDDLKKVGPNRPVVIGFHHWVGRDSVQVDNEQAFLDVIAPYNVRLLLIGHGHSNIEWNVNGIPAIMAQGLYQGAYHLIRVTSDSMEVLRRTTRSGAPTVPVMKIPLARPARPAWKANVTVSEGRGTVTVERGDIPKEGAVAFFRVDTGKEEPLTATDTGWMGSFATEGMGPGEHRVTVSVLLPEGGGRHLLTVPVRLSGPGTVSPVWTKDLRAAIQSRLVYSGNTVYVSTMGGTVYALDPVIGRERWKFTTEGAVFSTPLVADGGVYFGSADHYVYAVDEKTGKLRWKTKTEGAVFAGAAKAKDVICIASTDTKIYGLDAKTGKILWTAQGEGMYQSQAATDGERFFVGGWDNFFRGIDATTGKELWKNRFGRSFYYAPAIGSPTVGGGKVFVTSNDGLLHAMDAVTGKVLWETESMRLGYSGPLYREGRIYNGSLSDTGIVYCFDAETGKKLWETPTGSVIYDSSCAYGGGNVYIGTVSGVFSAIRASDGALVWQYRLGPGHLLASPATDSGKVYISSMGGIVYALPLN